MKSSSEFNYGFILLSCHYWCAHKCTIYCMFCSFFQWHNNKLNVKVRNNFYVVCCLLWEKLWKLPNIIVTRTRIVIHQRSIKRWMKFDYDLCISNISTIDFIGSKLFISHFCPRFIEWSCEASTMTFYHIAALFESIIQILFFFVFLQSENKSMPKDVEVRLCTIFLWSTRSLLNI